MQSEGDSRIKDPGKAPAQVPEVKLGLHKKGYWGERKGIAAGRTPKEGKNSISVEQSQDCCHCR